jgi:hypothetical protein
MQMPSKKIGPEMTVPEKSRLPPDRFWLIRTLNQWTLDSAGAGGLSANGSALFDGHSRAHTSARYRTRPPSPDPDLPVVPHARINLGIFLGAFCTEKPKFFLKTKMTPRFLRACGTFSTFCLSSGSHRNCVTVTRNRATQHQQGAHINTAPPCN